MKCDRSTRVFEREGKLVGIGDAQSSRGQGRSGDITAQLLEPLEVFCRNPGRCVQGETARSKAQRRLAHARGRVSQYSSQSLSGALPGGDDSAHRGGDGGNRTLCQIYPLVSRLVKIRR